MHLSSAMTATAFAVTLGIAAQAGAAPITVTTTNNASTLAGALAGSGITVSNPSFTGFSGGAGTFTGGNAAGIGFDTGIVLTSGQASSAGTGYTGSGLPSLDVGGPSTSLIGNSNDSSTLSFNFTSTTTAASFSYVFASAEYPDFVNSQFNDAFRFLINGQDIALLPGTTTQVSINTVNNGDTSGSGASNPSLFIDNRNGQNASLPFGGQTVVLSAGATGLVAGATNTLTLVIADVADSILDSAVFIQGASLTTVPPGGGGGGGTTPPPVGVPEPATAALLGAGLLGLAAMRRRRAG